MAEQLTISQKVNKNLQQFEENFICAYPESAILVNQIEEACLNLAVYSGLMVVNVSFFTLEGTADQAIYWSFIFQDLSDEHTILHRNNSMDALVSFAYDISDNDAYDLRPNDLYRNLKQITFKVG